MTTTQVLIAEVRTTGKLSKASWLELLSVISFKGDAIYQADYFIGQISALGYPSCAVWKQLVNAVELTSPFVYLNACTASCGINTTRLIEFIAEVGTAGSGLGSFVLIPGKDATDNLWFAKVTATGTTGYTDGNQHVTDMPTGWAAFTPGSPGPQGPKGDTGDTGPQGEPGQDAPLPQTYLYPPEAVPAGQPAWATGNYVGQSAFYKDADANVWQYLWNGAVWQKQQGDAAIWIDGGNASTTSFSNTIDGGNASTTSFSNTIDGGNA